MGHSPWGHKDMDMIEHTCTQIETVKRRVDIQPFQGLLFIINNVGYFCVYTVLGNTTIFTLVAYYAVSY